MTKACVNVPIRTGLPAQDDIPGQLRLHADRISNQEIPRPLAAIMLEFYDADTSALWLINIPTACARERIPIYSGAIHVLMRAIESANAEAST